MITVLLLVEAYPTPEPSSKLARLKKAFTTGLPELDSVRYSVWIVPGGTEGDDHIDDILERGGIRVLDHVSQIEAQSCVNDIRRKFAAAGLETKEESLCND